MQPTRLVVECELQKQFDFMIGHTKDSGFLALAIFVFFLLFSGCPSTVCLFSLFLVNFKRHLEAWNMNYSVLSRFQWIRLDANILEAMLRKTEEKRSFWYM